MSENDKLKNLRTRAINQINSIKRSVTTAHILAGLFFFFLLVAIAIIIWLAMKDPTLEKCMATEFEDETSAKTNADGVKITKLCKCSACAVCDVCKECPDDSGDDVDPNGDDVDPNDDKGDVTPTHLLTPEVYVIGKGDGGTPRGYGYAKNEIDGIVSKFNSTFGKNVKLATLEQLKTALKNGANWGYAGWVNDTTTAKAIMMYEPINGKLLRRSGPTAGITVYGMKPLKTDLKLCSNEDVQCTVSFNGKGWNKPQETESYFW